MHRPLPRPIEQVAPSTLLAAAPYMYVVARIVVALEKGLGQLTYVDRPCRQQDFVRNRLEILGFAAD